jgi:hypothetical protein
MPQPWSASPDQIDGRWAFESAAADTVVQLIALYEESIGRSDHIVREAES